MSYSLLKFEVSRTSQIDIINFQGPVLKTMQNDLRPFSREPPQLLLCSSYGALKIPNPFFLVRSLLLLYSSHRTLKIPNHFFLFCVCWKASETFSGAPTVEMNIGTNGATSSQTSVTMNEGQNPGCAKQRRQGANGHCRGQQC